jgi:hypothetical protein
MGEQQGLKLGRGYLKAFVFDQFLQPINDEELVIVVNVANIARM